MATTKIQLIGLVPEPPEPVTCTGCGACCTSLSHVSVGEDEVYVPLDAYHRNEAGELVMNHQEDGSCAALNLETRRCEIYEVRPRACRAFLVGCMACLAAREEAGIVAD